MNILTPTADGSNTLFNEEIGEHYHSAHGALQESKHVFIEAGLKHGLAQSGIPQIEILEVGFGTGLNFILSLDYCAQNNIGLKFTSIEAFPLTLETIESTGYHNFVMPQTWEKFTKTYYQALIEPTKADEKCELAIHHTTLQNFSTLKKFDVVFYDAFSVRHQPELWTDEIIAKVCNCLKNGGFFVTYAITGNLKRAIKACGFKIEKLPGAPGKREMLRAQKII
jgi:tRNA U34 5-methylaminomethyl-2-thiouridine-forming methyltransferase MnmC